ncbi:MAG: CDP-alcohol phosphatidyltransferase family protein [Candidatus Altiarchaeota archaeon]|nr:CDP-alcohol phosphatidyltransferase family protein [Candidatus Altiarchaeota archaeon]
MLSLVVGYSRALDAVKTPGRRLADALLSPLVRLLYHLKVSPNAISLLAVMSVFLSSMLLFTGSILYLPMLLAAIFFDLLDGSLARFLKAKGISGNKLDFDYLCDHFSDTLLMLALYAANLLPFYAAIILLFSHIISSILVLAARERSASVCALSFRLTLLCLIIIAAVWPGALYYGILLLSLHYLLTSLAILPTVLLTHNDTPRQNI